MGTTTRRTRMRRLWISSALVTVALLGTAIVSDAASSSDGKPVILGTAQYVSKDTRILSLGTGGYPVLSIGANATDEAALEVGGYQNAPAIEAEGKTGLASYGDVRILGASSQLHYGRTVVVQASERRLTINFG